MRSYLLHFYWSKTIKDNLEKSSKKNSNGTCEITMDNTTNHLKRSLFFFFQVSHSIWKSANTQQVLLSICALSNSVWNYVWTSKKMSGSSKHTNEERRERKQTLRSRSFDWCGEKHSLRKEFPPNLNCKSFAKHSPAFQLVHFGLTGCEKNRRWLGAIARYAHGRRQNWFVLNVKRILGLSPIWSL